jgi:VWFA-related protein
MRTSLLAVVSTFLLTVLGADRQPPQSATFRTWTTLIPVDVRVLDRNGNPVTSLTRDDFTIFEDGTVQKIGYFERQALEPGLREPATSAVADEPLLVGQQRRVFLIVLGRLWMPEELFGTTQAITGFIRNELLPRDLVAVSAWNRVTDLTTHHEMAARTVERLESYLDSIDRRGDRIGWIRRLYRAAPETEAELDEVFRPESGRSRTIPTAQRPPVRRLLEQIGSHAAGVASANAAWAPPQYRDEATGRQATAIARMLAGQLLHIFGGIEYLRHIAGEKHIVYFSRGGLWLPAVDDDRALARIASDARVVIDVIQTPGPARVYDEFGRPGNPRVSLEPSMASKNVVELTGGQASFGDYAERALARIDTTTRFGYLLGYYPSNSNLDGRHRKLKVVVRRPSGAVVRFRHSYLAAREARYDYRDFLAQDRIVAAAECEEDIPDVGVTMTVAAKATAIAVDVLIDPRQVTLHLQDARRVGTLDVAFFCLDRRRRIIGEFWQKLDLKLTEEAYQRAVQEGLKHTTTVPFDGTARYVKLVVYDYSSDRAGSTMARVR